MNAAELAARLAAQAEAVCRHYLPAGRRAGAYWRVGDVRNTPGASLYVRLRPPGAGKWTDAATGDHGDLLDLIAANQGLAGLRETMDEAQRFLSLPRRPDAPQAAAPAGSSEAARRLFASARPLRSTPAERYLLRRGLAHLEGARWLRFHPRCFYRGEDGDSAWPALVAAVTDLQGQVTGVQRLWLTRAGDKAPLPEPRRALGQLLGNAVRFGEPTDVLAAGEGLESVLSARQVLPSLPVAAALSAAHLAALTLPPGLQRLYIAFDADPAGRSAATRLAERARALGVEAIPLAPQVDDLNADLLRLGPGGLTARLRPQVRPQDWERFASSGR